MAGEPWFIFFFLCAAAIFVIGQEQELNTTNHTAIIFEMVSYIWSFIHACNYCSLDLATVWTPLFWSANKKCYAGGTTAANGLEVLQYNV
jgi:hypothetical protein